MTEVYFIGEPLCLEAAPEPSWRWRIGSCWRSSFPDPNCTGSRIGNKAHKTIDIELSVEMPRKKVLVSSRTNQENNAEAITGKWNLIACARTHHSHTILKYSCGTIQVARLALHNMSSDADHGWYGWSSFHARSMSSWHFDTSLVSSPSVCTSSWSFIGLRKSRHVNQNCFSHVLHEGHTHA